MTHSRASTLSVLTRAARRLQRHALSLSIAFIVVLWAKLGLLWINVNEAVPPVGLDGVPPPDIILDLFSLATNIAFLGFIIFILGRDATPRQSLDSLPQTMKRLAIALALFLWRTWLWMPMLGSLTLLINQDAFGPSVAVLWIIGLIGFIVRGPYLILAPIIAVLSEEHAKHSLHRSRELTRGARTYLAMVILSAIILMILPLFALIGLAFGALSVPLAATKIIATTLAQIVIASALVESYVALTEAVKTA